MKAVSKSLARIFGFMSSIPFRFNKHQITPPESISHSKWFKYLEKNFNKEGMRILEIGSRNVTGSNYRNKFSRASYIGFDLYEGENVDVVGDAHKLTSYFLKEEKFDLIFSSALFEHLYMPWIVALEIQKLLKIGGMVFVETHFSFGSHERPWNFFQFSDMGLRVLFNKGMGFDLIDKGMSNPIVGYFAPDSDSYLRYLPVSELYCHSEILCQKTCEIDEFDWGRVMIDDVIEGSSYPRI